MSSRPRQDIQFEKAEETTTTTKRRRSKINESIKEKNKKNDKIEERKSEKFIFFQKYDEIFTSTLLKFSMPPTGSNNALTTSAFATYVLSLLGYFLYLLHAFLPSHVLDSTLRIPYYPSQLWSLILPAWLTVTIWYMFIVYFARNLSVTPPIDGADGLASITDDSALIMLPHPQSPSHHSDSCDHPVPVLRDLPSQVINQFYFS